MLLSLKRKGKNHGIPCPLGESAYDLHCWQASIENTLENRKIQEKETFGIGVTVDFRRELYSLLNF